MAIAVVDKAGYLMTFGRTDAGSFPASGIAIDKAWTAVSFALSAHGGHASRKPGAARRIHCPRVVAGGGCPFEIAKC